MTAGCGDFEVEAFTLLGDFDRVTGFGEEGVILGLNHEGGDCDLAQERFAASTDPVVLGIDETIDGGCEAIVELSEGFDLVDSCEVEFTWELLVLLDDFFFEAIHESSHVEFVLPFAEL